MIAFLSLIRLEFATFGVLLTESFATTDTAFCGSVFRSEVDHVLVGHVMTRAAVSDDFECGLKCHAHNTCKSFNIRPAAENRNHICELNNKTRLMIPGDFKEKKGSTYYEVSCVDVPRDQTKQTIQGHCYPIRCQNPKAGSSPEQPAHSCKDIRDLRGSKGDGTYWIDPEKSGNPLQVYCDMTTDGGGWLLISNVTMQSSTPPSQVPVKNSYRGISNDQMFLTKDAMRELITHLAFTQLRFHCSKQQGRTFHVTTAENSSGKAVVQYFSGKTDAMPAACGSFVRMSNDNSRLARKCKKWGYENGRSNVGKWGQERDQERLYRGTIMVWYGEHWLLAPDVSRWECDDFTRGVSRGDFWKVFVR